MTGPAIAPFPHGITIRVHRGPRDRFGDITRVFHHSIDGCAISPRYSTELAGNQSRVIIGFTVYGPPQTGDNRLFADDQVETPDGIFYNVVGEAADWGPHPMTGWIPGFEAALERVK